MKSQMEHAWGGMLCSPTGPMQCECRRLKRKRCATPSTLFWTRGSLECRTEVHRRYRDSLATCDKGHSRGRARRRRSSVHSDATYAKPKTLDSRQSVSGRATRFTGGSARYSPAHVTAWIPRAISSRNARASSTVARVIGYSSSPGCVGSRSDWWTMVFLRSAISIRRRLRI
jgi:hypothetical protein